MVVTVSHAGYIKRVPLSAYRAQRRGGKGRAGMQTREEDFVTKIFVASTHTPCCSSPQPAWFIARRFGGCRSVIRKPAARR